MGKGHRAEVSVYFGHMSSFLFELPEHVIISHKLCHIHKHTVLLAKSIIFIFRKLIFKKIKLRFLEFDKNELQAFLTMFTAVT